MDPISSNPGVWHMVSSAGLMVKFVLLVLLALSVLSWAIIINKIMVLKKVEDESDSFYSFFLKNNTLSNIWKTSKNYPNSPHSRIFSIAYPELKLSADGVTTSAKTGLLGRLLRKTIESEKGFLEKNLPFLATTGNTAPFIGLFGTVWGIMNTFTAIGAKGSANLAVVAPGIAEALIATAMGLFAAIPAVIGYNYLLNRIERVSVDMEGFSSDLINMAEAGTDNLPANPTESGEG